MTGPQHSPECATTCIPECPNRLQNISRSAAARCKECGRINCPDISHAISFWDDWIISDELKRRNR